MDTIRLKKDPPMPEPDPALTPPPQPEPVPVESLPVGVLQHIRPGDQLGPYTLISRLGRGNFGVVWLAERRGAIATTNIALKMPLDEDVPLDSLRREASLWVRVSGHPNILPIIEAEVYSGQIVIASEYVSGGSLA
ncbi:MAG TPA: protein kinase, partial [Acidobacteriota bacterium]|nr:protein kinase [Acidobacteriota bacterium]